MIGLNLRTVAALIIGCVAVVADDSDIVDHIEFLEQSGEEFNASDIDLNSPQYDIRREMVGNLLELSGELFVKYINANETDLWFVEFYDLSSKPSVEFAKDWADIAQELKGEMYVGRIDTTYFTGIGATLAIEEYPSLRLFKDGYVWPYTGEMEVEPILDFARGGYENTPKTKFFKKDVPATFVGKVKGAVLNTAFIIAEICLQFPFVAAILVGYGMLGGLPMGLILAWFVLRKNAPVVPKGKAHAEKTD